MLAIRRKQVTMPPRPSAPRLTPMYTQNDGAWVKNAAEETQMVETMRRGSDLVVKSESARGTKTTDTYSLKGDRAGARQGRRGVQVNIRVADARASSVAKPSDPD